MATPPLIFPSLSRQPSMDSSKTLEDDTIRDPAESGYVATRPRFTRTRRTWKANVRNLVAEDIRTLDEFSMSPSFAARGGNSFLYPNLLPNWSFEFPAVSSGDLVYGWAAANPNPQQAVSASSGAARDGGLGIAFTTVTGQTVVAGADLHADVECDNAIPCTPGEVYQVNAWISVNQGSLPNYKLIAYNSVVYFNAGGAEISEVGLTTIPTPATAGWQIYGASFTVISGAASFKIKLVMQIDNAAEGSTNITLDDTVIVAFDEVGCALLTPLSPYGRMIGSQSLGCLVRFSSLPETSDVGWGNGVKVYGAHFELTEV